MGLSKAMRPLWLLLCAVVCLPGVAAELPSKASNLDSIINTRHNLTQSFLGGNKVWMDGSRNDYGQVCVYCHTPHGANTLINAPLWNRTQRSTTYTTYDQLGTATAVQPYSQPGTASLTCLSCHDGQTAVDSIINMPGSGRYSASQLTSQDNDFLDAWPVGPGAPPWVGFGGHGTLSNTPATLANFGECQSCHSINGDQFDPSTNARFDVFFIGTDLRNDHPVGVQFPTGNPDFRNDAVASGGLKIFDSNGNGRADKDEIRLFRRGGDAYEVECATCHDPHGVPSAGPGSAFLPTFLRKTNEGSAVCLSCHIK
jgi:hypothetical protein